MATLDLTIAQGNQAGARLRRLASQIEKLAAQVPDNNAGGASVVVRIDNTAGSVCSLAFQSGPYTGGPFYV
jgi:hypothetical protein